MVRHGNHGATPDINQGPGVYRGPGEDDTCTNGD